MIIVGCNALCVVSCNILSRSCAGSLNIALGFHCFPSPSFCPPYPRLVFPPTLPIILDVITHYNVTHKGKRLLCLVTDLHRPGPNSSLPACWLKQVSWKSHTVSLTARASNICTFIIYRQHAVVLKRHSLKYFARQQETSYFCTSDNNLSQAIWCHLKAEEWSEPLHLHTN